MSDALARLTAALVDRYTIQRELGVGGMATVYLAEDIKHHRKVAIKVLRPELSAAMGSERFLREIETTANLRHPHILPLYDSGTTGEDEGRGFPRPSLYYVMPFIEGESLRDRLDREKQLPLEDALRIAREVADALSYAHSRGVIHRDIKPENILLDSGHAVVADFGIARAVAAAGGERLTETGMAIGTPTYMSPEQAAGESDLDGRTDLYALACVLYEMLAGQPPFTGPTTESIVRQHIVGAPPPITQFRPAVPADVVGVLEKALAKTPADRFNPVAQFADALDRAGTTTSPISAPRSRWLIPAAALVIVAAVAAGFLLRGRGQSDALPVIARTTQVTRDPGLELDPALSPDGTLIAYAQGPAMHMQIYVQPISGGRRVALTADSTDNFRSPQWSPDGTQIAFAANDGIFVVASLGGAPRRVMRVPASDEAYGTASNSTLAGLAWAPDGQRLAYADAVSGLHVIAIAGGTPVSVATPGNPSSPAWSPDGSRIAFVSGNSGFTYGTGYLGNVGISSIWVVPVAGGAATRVSDAEHLNTSPLWTTSGKGLYWVSNIGGSRDIYLMSVDGKGRPAGEPQRLTTGVEAHGISRSADGAQLAYSTFKTYSNIWSLPIPRAGAVSIASAREVTSGYQTIEMLDISPDGRFLVFDSDRDGNPEIYRMSSAGGEPLRLTTDAAGDFGPAWSPDGKEIVFHSLRAGSRDLYTMLADGTGLTRRTTWPAHELDARWSPDGTMLAYESFTDTTNAQPSFGILPLDGGEGSVKLLDFPGDFIAWEPTGSRLTYHSADGMRVVPSSGGTSRLLVDNAADGGIASLGIWSPDGATYYYLTRRPTGWEIRAIPGEGGASRTVVRFDDPARQPTRYGFSTDGRHFYLTLGSNESDIGVLQLKPR